MGHIFAYKAVQSICSRPINTVLITVTKLIEQLQKRARTEVNDTPDAIFGACVVTIKHSDVVVIPRTYYNRRVWLRRNRFGHYPALVGLGQNAR